MTTLKSVLSIAAGAILLSACVTAPSDHEGVGSILPPVKQYSQAQMTAVADDLESGILAPATTKMITDYGIMREQIRNAKQSLGEK